MELDDGDGFLGDSDIDGIIERINLSETQILFIALGSPKQELWMHRHLQELGATVSMGVGAAFDFYSGRVRRAPGITCARRGVVRAAGRDHWRARSR